MDQPEKPKSKASEEEFPPSVVFLGSSPDDEPLRKIGIYGNINEEYCAEIVYSLLSMGEKARHTDELGVVSHLPLEIIISTHGGDATEMFAVYDVIRMVKENCEVGTYGVGKVMSAGVLLLAAGTKGSRKIGKHCRVMLHSVASGHVGELHSLENELEEVQHTQKQYVSALAKETKMSVKQIRKFLDKKINVYFTADEAVKYGIADEVI